MVTTMGIRENMKWYAFYDTHTIKDGNYNHLPKGKFKKIRKPIGGAVAEYESGAYAGEQTTLGRVALGAVIAGPVGAIVGGMFRKDRTRGYVTVTFPDGEVVILDGPIKDELKMREFASKVNAASAHYSVE